MIIDTFITFCKYSRYTIGIYRCYVETTPSPFYPHIGQPETLVFAQTLCPETIDLFFSCGEFAAFREAAMRLSRILIIEPAIQTYRRNFLHLSI